MGGYIGCGSKNLILIATDKPKQYNSLSQVQEEIKSHTKKIEELTQTMLDLAMAEGD